MYQQVYENFNLEKEFPFAYFRTSDRQAFFHYHDCLELNIVKKGSGYYIINGRRYEINTGDIFVINNKEPHMAVHGEEFELEVLIFDIDLLWRNKGISNFLTPFFSRKDEFSHKISVKSESYKEMSQLFTKIEKEYLQREKGWQICVEAQLMNLLALIYRCYEKKQELEENNDNFQKMYSRVSVVLEYIGENFKDEITLDELAKKVSLTQHYLCKCFKKVTGRTIFQYIEQMRIQYSCYLLKTTDEDIMDIAMNSGFNSVNYYNRVFKKILNKTPREYRLDNK